VPAQADGVEAVVAGGVAAGHGEGQDVAVEARRRAEHRPAADPHPLVHQRPGPQHGLRTDLDVATELDQVRQDRAGPHEAVVGDVDPRHQQGAVADAGALALAGGPMHRHVLAQVGAGADVDPARFAAEAGVHRGAADDRVRPDPRAGAHARAVEQHRAGAHHGAFGHLDVALDDDEGFHPDAGGQPRARVDHGAGVDRGRGGMVLRRART
jgi:hypothetical protein